MENKKVCFLKVINLMQNVRKMYVVLKKQKTKKHLKLEKYILCKNEYS